MLEKLSGKLGDLVRQIGGKAQISEKNIQDAINEIKIALLEADVNLRVVRRFVNQATEEALGEKVLRSVTPGQMVVKIVHDELAAMLGEDSDGIVLRSTPPVPILMVGLQGSGKTTTAAKIALRLKDRDKKKVLMASLDVQRPAAQEQLAILGRQAGVFRVHDQRGQVRAAEQVRELLAGVPVIDVHRQRAGNHAAEQRLDVGDRVGQVEPDGLLRPDARRHQVLRHLLAARRQLAVAEPPAVADQRAALGHRGRDRSAEIGEIDIHDHDGS